MLNWDIVKRKMHAILMISVYTIYSSCGLLLLSARLVQSLSPSWQTIASNCFKYGMMWYSEPMELDMSKVPKYRQIHDSLKQAIATGEYSIGAKLPSESELVMLFGASRLTVNRALRELQLSGLIERRVGSGSYVSAAPLERGFAFGLLIPGLGETEVFEPICRGMAEAHLPEHHVLLWGKSPADSPGVEKQARDWCEQWIARKVSGVFFAPLEYSAEKDVVNRRIAELFQKAGVPVVLIDRDLVDFPDRSNYDLVCIDNRRAAYVLTTHLLSTGCKRVIFIGRLWPAPSCVARSLGYCDALRAAGAESSDDFLRHIEPSDEASIRRIIEEIRPDGIVCSNDYMAAHVMRMIESMSLGVPEDIKLAGFDDVRYARLLSVPLTTVRQPCHELGAAAISAMTQRVLHPGLPARDILMNFQLVIRASSGGSRGACDEEIATAVASR
jgi:GntR family transcriptional regulator, arabinose operon transcriptional repressor